MRDSMLLMSSVTSNKFILDKGFPCQQHDAYICLFGFDKGLPCQWRSQKTRLTSEALVNARRHAAGEFCHPKQISI